ncbi:MAG: peptidylprolyl isomerase [Deltaproteobacteria bacterium]|nr:peptidylprolyl isomerase [Deltaproteobacteria bacterium]
MSKFVHFETDKGEIVAELFEKEAPMTVENFAGLASGAKEWIDPKAGKVKRPFYDGLSFHRVIANFVIQGGCPQGTGTGGPGYHIKCETAGNPHKHQRGSLSMAHAGKDTGGSQFFICHSPQLHLDGKHTVFGKVVKGIEVVDAIRAGDRMNRVWIEDR